MPTLGKFKINIDVPLPLSSGPLLRASVSNRIPHRISPGNSGIIRKRENPLLLSVSIRRTVIPFRRPMLHPAYFYIEKILRESATAKLTHTLYRGTYIYILHIYFYTYIYLLNPEFSGSQFLELRKALGILSDATYSPLGSREIVCAGNEKATRLLRFVNV